MEDRKLLSLQEIVADIHRSAEEINEHCIRSGDDGVDDKIACRNVTAASYPTAPLINKVRESKDSFKGPAVTSVNFDIKIEPPQEDDIDEILENLECYEGVRTEGPLKSTLDESPAKKLDRNPAVTLESEIISAKVCVELESLQSGFPPARDAAYDRSSCISETDEVREDMEATDVSLQDVNGGLLHPTISKTVDSNTHLITSNNDTQDHRSVSSENDCCVSDVKPIDNSANFVSSHIESNQSSSCPKSHEKSADRDSSNKPEKIMNASESSQVQVRHDEIQPEFEKKDFEESTTHMIEAVHKDVKTTEYVIPSQTNSESDKPESSQTDIIKVSQSEAAESPKCSHTVEDDVTHHSLMTSQVEIQSATLNDSIMHSYISKTQNLSPSRSNHLQDENFAKSQNIDDRQDRELEAESHDSPMTSRDLSQNLVDDHSNVDNMDYVAPDGDEKNGILKEDTTNQDKHTVVATKGAIQLTQSFKKDVTNYVMDHLSINDASAHFGIPFNTIDAWIRKLYKGVAADWLVEVLAEKPIGETVYTEHFKNAVVAYIRKRRCSAEYAAEMFNIDSYLIRCWKSKANKGKNPAVMSTIQSPQVIKKLGLDVDMYDRNKDVMVKKIDEPLSDTPGQSDEFSHEFIISVVRYIKRRKCSLEKASKSLNIPVGILKTWIETMKAKLKNHKLNPSETRQLLRIWPGCRPSINTSVSVDSSSAQESPKQLPELKQRFVLWKSRQKNNGQTTENECKLNHRTDGKTNLPADAQGFKLALQHQGFASFRKSVMMHVRRTKSSTLTAKYFGIPINTVYGWGRYFGIELESVPASKDVCSQEFVDAIRAFAKKRKCSLMYAAEMFHINPKFIMPWKNPLLKPKKGISCKILPKPKPLLPRPNLEKTNDADTVGNLSGTGVLKMWVTEHRNADPEDFRLCCEELYPPGQLLNRYSREYRIDVMRHLVLKNLGVTETAVLFNMPRRTVYDWLMRWSEVKIKILKRKSSEIENLTSSQERADAGMQDLSHFEAVDHILESSSDNEMPSSQQVVIAKRESSSEDPDYDPSKGDLNDNDRRRLRKGKNRRVSNNDSQNLSPHSLSVAQTSVFRQPESSGGSFSLERYFSDKAPSIFKESQKYDHGIIDETYAVPSDKPEGVNYIEEKLEKFIREQISILRTVTLPTVKFYALKFAAELEISDFVPTSTWCMDFLQRTGLTTSIKCDSNLKMKERQTDDVKAGALERKESEAKGNTSTRNTATLKLAECVKRHHLDMKHPSLMPLPPDMLKTLGSSSSQLSKSSAPITFELPVELSRKNKTPYFLMKKSSNEGKDKTTSLKTKQLKLNSSNETKMSMRGHWFRSRLVDYARKRGIRLAAKNCGVAENCIRKWLEQKPDSVSTDTPNMVVRDTSTSNIMSVEKDQQFLPDTVKSLKSSKRPASDSMAAIGEAFSLEVAKLPKFSDDIPTGTDAKTEFFYLDKDYAFLDHAGKGSRLQKSLRLSHCCQERIELQPQFFYRKQYSSYIDSLRKRFSEFIGCDSTDFIFTDTVSCALETVLRDLQLSRCSSIYFLNFSSAETNSAIKNICEETGCRAQEELLLLPLQSQEDILSVVSETLREDTTLAVFDHCPIDYGFMLPVKEITLLCHMKGVPVLINGSDGIGQDSLNLSYLGSDYYVGSCDRWLCSAKGCSFLYMKAEEQQEKSRSNRNAESLFQSRYYPKDSNELCSCLAVAAALNFWNTLGVDNIRIYCQCLLKKAVDLFQSRWDVELLAPFDMHGMICCVSLPSSLFDDGLSDSTSKIQLIEDQLFNEYKIIVPVVCVQNKLYVRISVHIYNDLADFERLANAIVEMEADST